MKVIAGGLDKKEEPEVVMEGKVIAVEVPDELAEAFEKLIGGMITKCENEDNLHPEDDQNDNADTGDPLVENGTPVATMSKPFKPLLKNGKVKVEFEISTKGLEGKELVAFETAYRLEGYKKGDAVSKTPGVIVAEHKDLKDKGQTIKVVKPGTPIEHSPKTGDDAPILVAAVLMLAAAAFAYGLYRRRKSGEDDSEETEE